MSGEAVLRGSPPLSPVKDGSKAQVTNPLSAIFMAYKPLDCSFDAPKGPHTARAIPLLPLFGKYKSPTRVIPY